MICEHCRNVYGDELQVCPHCGQTRGIPTVEEEIHPALAATGLDLAATLSVSGSESIRGRLHPRSFWQILGEAFRLYRQHWKLLSLAVLLFFTPLALVHFGYLQSLNDLSSSDAGNGAGLDSSGWFLLDLAVNGAAFFLSVFAISRAVSESYLGRPVTLSGILLPTKRFWGFLGSGLVAGTFVGASFMAVYTGLILLSTQLYWAVVGREGASNIPLYLLLVLISLLGGFLASLITGAWLLVAGTSSVIEGKGAVRSLRRGVRLVEGFFWKAAVILTIAVLGDTIVQNAVTAPYTVRSMVIALASRFSCNVSRPDPIPVEILLLSILLGLVAAALILPLLIIPIVLFYYDLRIRKEAFDLQVLAGEIDPENSEAVATSLPVQTRRRGIHWVPLYAVLLLATGVADITALGLQKVHQRQTHGGYKFKENPDSADHVEQALADLKKGDTIDARSELDEAVQIDPKDARAHYIIGWLAVQNGANSRGFREFKLASEFQPGYGLPLIYWGLGLDETGNHSEALDKWHEAIRTQPDLVQSYFFLGDSLFEHQQLQGALHAYQDGLRYMPASEPLKQRIARIQADIVKRDADQGEDRRVANLHPGSMDAMNFAAEDLFDQGDIQGEIRAWLKAIAAHPNDSHAHRELGTTLYNSNAYYQAQLHQEAAVRLMPTDGFAFFNLGNTYSVTEQWALALHAYEEAARLRPGERAAILRVNDVREKVAKTEGEMAQAQDQIKANPNDASAHLNVAKAALTLNQTDLALHEFSEAARLNPGNADAHNELGYLYWIKKQPDDAIRECREAIQESKDKSILAMAHCNLGHALYDKKQFAEARAEWQTVLTIEDGTPAAGEAQEAITEL